MVQGTWVVQQQCVEGYNCQYQSWISTEKQKTNTSARNSLNTHSAESL